MANATNQVDYAAEDLATFLAKAVSDGTYADVVGDLKVDAGGNGAAASDIASSVGQLWGNLVDDFFQSSYPFVRAVATGNLTGPIEIAGDLDVTGNLDLSGSNGIVKIGDGNGTGPTLRIDADLVTGSGNLQFFKNNSLRWWLRNNTAQDFTIANAALGTILEFTDSNGLVTAKFDMQVDGVLDHARDEYTQGSGIGTADFAISAGWGSGSSVSAAGGTDARGFVEITAAGTPAADPTVTLTFVDGAWSAAPFAMLQRNDASAPNPTGAFLTYTTTTTTLVITFRGTPVAGNTYRIEWRAYG